MLSSSDIRNTFLEFFKKKQHHIFASAPLVIKNDPTLMFTNAGMNQFKEYFLEVKKAPYARIADTQKCLRVSGKHNDLEEVGVDSYHHTMFEMLGNWSFDDYFKEEAVAWSWELLTEVYGIDKERLYVTIFEGDESQNIPKDKEAYEIWTKYVPQERILLGNKKDNFWEMGDTGPCGPCTEIHIDARPEEERLLVSGADLVNQDHPDVIEIWNNVFIQYDKKKDGNLESLKGRYVDTGMGFERLVRIIQNKKSNYDTDVFTGTIDKISSLVKHSYEGSDSKSDVAYRVLADHIRAIAFSITDGQLPSNTGAGYVIRRILRRAVRYYYSYLDRTEALLYLLVEGLAEQFAEVFPELQKQQETVTKIIHEEEQAFLHTLEKGLGRMDQIMADADGKIIEGEQAFELYDTFGFPLDLTILIASENGLEVDEKGFATSMKKQKERSRKATTIDADDWVVLREGMPESTFVGYDNTEVAAEITRYRKVKMNKKEIYQIVLNTTPFYPEGGGQVGDKGELIGAEASLKIFDVKKENNQILHFTDQNPQQLADEKVKARVNLGARIPTASNHTATHLLHAALREILGNHVEQKGSLVTKDVLRFDFSHYEKVSAEDLQQIEEYVNSMIEERHPVYISEMSKEAADAKGAMALFGEKYGSQVRVVEIKGTPSVELCGGTHVDNSSELAMFKIVGESSVASGIRRIEALSGHSCKQYLLKQNMELEAVRKLLPVKNIAKEVEKLKEQNNQLSKELESYKQREVARTTENLRTEVVTENNTSRLIKVLKNSSVDELKKTAFGLRPDMENFIIVLASQNEGKFGVVVLLDENLVEERGWDASALLKNELAPLIQGGGGGQKSLATGAGKNAISEEKLEKVVLDFLS